jgi:hypothetical protein
MDNNLEYEFERMNDGEFKVYLGNHWVANVGRASSDEVDDLIRSEGYESRQQLLDEMNDRAIKVFQKWSENNGGS